MLTKTTSFVSCGVFSATNPVAFLAISHQVVLLFCLHACALFVSIEVGLYDLSTYSRLDSQLVRDITHRQKNSSLRSNSRDQGYKRLHVLSEDIQESNCIPGLTIHHMQWSTRSYRMCMLYASYVRVYVRVNY